jgi:hypothetical protein
MSLGWVGIGLGCAGAWGQSRPAERRWEPVGRFDSPEVQESSGVVKSRRYAGVFWTHGDSGNPAAIFAFRENGQVLARIDVEGALNIDWEDIAADEDGYLYLGDIGNNFAVLTQRYIYKVREPDPFAKPPQPIKPESIYVYTFEGRPFDAEALLLIRGELYIISKPEHGSASLYRLEAPDAKRPHQLVPRAVAKLPLGRVTGGDVAPDGKLLAVCTCDTLEVYRLPESGPPVFNDDALLGRVRFPCGSVEACCFDSDPGHASRHAGARVPDDDIILTAESDEIYRVHAADLKERVNFR